MNMRILGVDPGTTRIGYGLIESVSEPKLVTYGVLEISAKDYNERIIELASQFSKLLDTLQPTCAGVESLFFSKNQKTALAVSEARGILMLLLLQKQIPVVSLRPAEIKLAVTNYAAADKRAVAKMVERTLRIEKIGGHDDASDALAIALAAAGKHALDERLGKTIIA